MNIKIIERLPTATEYNYLRELAGWGTYDHESIEESLPKSLYSVCLEESDKIIGMGRIVGDSKLCFYIQDVIVDPKYQGKGFGSSIMKHIMDYINNHRCKNSVIGLMSAKGKEDFYRKFGFTIRPDEIFGNGMHFLDTTE